MSAPFAIFPVGPDKAPLMSGWQSRATRDRDTIARWRSEGVEAWGIPCGAANDLFVIDLDVDKQTGARVGQASLEALGRYSNLLAQINVTTPSGGAHIYLKHFDGARNTTSRLGPKIDTRGEGGYVVAPGSVIRDGAYSGHFPPERPVVPVGLRARLLQPRQPIHQRAAEAPRDEVEALLRHIPPDLPYGDWLSVLMALHDRFRGSDEGLNLADDWSAQGAKYRHGEVLKKWRSFKRSGVTWATVPALARRNGANLSKISQRYAR